MRDDETFGHRDRCATSGIGWTDFSRSSGRSDLTLATQASLAAITDAGLTPQDIDGIVAATWISFARTTSSTRSA